MSNYTKETLKNIGGCKASEQEPLIPPIDRDKAKRWGRTTYQEEYDEIAYRVLTSGTAKTKAHVCKALRCSKTVLENWIRQFPNFAEAIQSGLTAGEAIYRDRIGSVAFYPSGQVNNGLIKLLANNVYGIKEDTDPAVIVNNTVNNASPEEEMKRRGIPVPDIGVDDLEDEL